MVITIQHGRGRQHTLREGTDPDVAWCGRAAAGAERRESEDDRVQVTCQRCIAIVATLARIYDPLAAWETTTASDETRCEAPAHDPDLEREAQATDSEMAPVEGPDAH